VEAVRGVDLNVRAREIFSLLGPNGAGKTTTMRMPTTLLAIDGGSAEVAGIDVARRPHEVRRRVGYVGQLGGADLPATGPSPTSTPSTTRSPRHASSPTAPSSPPTSATPSS
jgi:ABC-2 type transport system ATP-binding protein